MAYQEPEFLPWDGQRVPITLLGGYLGAGKTTLINEVLRRSEARVAVLVNDVGSVNVDAKLLRRRSRTTLEFTDGCVCCSLSGGLGLAFDELRMLETPPEWVILELSGVAEPNRVVPWTNTAGFRLDGVVTLVDADSYPEFSDHDVIGPTVDRQIRDADLLVVTKLDLASDQNRDLTMARLDDLAPDTPRITSNQFGAAGIVSLGAGLAREQRPVPEPTLFDVHHTDIIDLPDPITAADLAERLTRLPDDVLRAKGIANLDDGTQVLIQVVGRRIARTTIPQAERTEATDLVVITPAC